MKITKISPRGFCKGVVDAWVMSKNVRKENPNARIIMIGQLVHNKELVNDILKENIEIIDDTSKSRLSIIEELEFDQNTILIFSAHGTDEKAIALAKQKGFKVIDATCVFVSKTRDIIKQKINDGYEIIFIGKHNHPETNAMLAIDNKIIFIEELQDIKKYKFEDDKKYLLTNQTTISIYDFYEIIKELKNLVKNLECENEICTATLERQNAIINMDKTIDILIVVGDSKSNNSNKLVDIAKSNNIESHLISNKDELKDSWFKDKKHIAITSGASTPTWITNEVINDIETKWGNDD